MMQKKNYSSFLLNIKYPTTKQNSDPIIDITIRVVSSVIKVGQIGFLLITPNKKLMILVPTVLLALCFLLYREFLLVVFYRYWWICW